MTLHTAQMRMR